MRILGFIVFAIFLAGPIPARGTELRVLVSDNSGMPIYGVFDGEVQKGEITLSSLESKSDFSATADLGDVDGAAFDVPPGTYGIHVSSQGWREFEGVIRITSEPRVVRIALHLGQITNFWPAPPEPSLNGRVIGLRGQAAWVQLSPLYGPSRAWRSTLHNVGVGAQGEFAFSLHQAGRYVLLVFSEGTTESSDPVLLASKSVDVGINAVVEVEVDSPEPVQARLVPSGLATPDEAASGTELSVLLFSPDGSPVTHGEVRAQELYGASKRVWDAGNGSRLELPPGDYQLQVAASGFAPYQGEIAKGSLPQVVRIGLTPEQPEAAAILRGGVIRREPDARHLWVDLQPVYELAWPLRVLNNTAVKTDGSFTFAGVQPGLYTLLMYGDRPVPEDTLFYEAPYELLRAQVVRVEGTTSIEVRLDAADEAAPSILRIP